MSSDQPPYDSACPQSSAGGASAQAPHDDASAHPSRAGASSHGGRSAGKAASKTRARGSLALLWWTLPLMLIVLLAAAFLIGLTLWSHASGVAYRSGNYDKAMGGYDGQMTVTQRGPERWLAFYNKGTTFLAEGEVDGGVSQLSTAFELVPKAVKNEDGTIEPYSYECMVRNNLAVGKEIMADGLEAQGDHLGARETYDEALELIQICRAPDDTSRPQSGDQSQSGDEPQSDQSQSGDNSQSGDQSQSSDQSQSGGGSDSDSGSDSNSDSDSDSDSGSGSQSDQQSSPADQTNDRISPKRDRANDQLPDGQKDRKDGEQDDSDGQGGGTRQSQPKPDQGNDPNSTPAPEKREDPYADETQEEKDRREELNRRSKETNSDVDPLDGSRDTRPNGKW